MFFFLYCYFPMSHDMAELRSAGNSIASVIFTNGLVFFLGTALDPVLKGFGVSNRLNRKIVNIHQAVCT